MKLRWTEPALRDLESVGDHIAKADPAAAARVVSRIFARIDDLLEISLPGSCRSVAGTRELVITTTPFLVPYRVEGEHIEILAVFHGARRWPESFDRGGSRRLLHLAVILCHRARGASAPVRRCVL